MLLKMQRPDIHFIVKREFLHRTTVSQAAQNINSVFRCFSLLRSRQYQIYSRNFKHVILNLS